MGATVNHDILVTHLLHAVVTFGTLHTVNSTLVFHNNSSCLLPRTAQLSGQRHGAPPIAFMPGETISSGNPAQNPVNTFTVKQTRHRIGGTLFYRIQCNVSKIFLLQLVSGSCNANFLP